MPIILCPLQDRAPVHHLRPNRGAVEQPLLLHQLYALWCARQSCVFHLHRPRHRALRSRMPRTWSTASRSVNTSYLVYGNNEHVNDIEIMSNIETIAFIFIQLSKLHMTSIEMSNLSLNRTQSITNNVCTFYRPGKWWLAYRRTLLRVPLVQGSWSSSAALVPYSRRHIGWRQWTGDA